MEKMNNAFPRNGGTRRMSAVYSALVLLIGIGFNTATSADIDYSVYKDKWIEYVTWAQGVMPEREVALAVAPNGSWCSHHGRTKAEAKQKAIHCCEYQYKGKTCSIKDVNLKSDFIREPEITSKYCATEAGVSFVEPSVCRQDGGLTYESYESAKIKSEELKKEQSQSLNSESESQSSKQNVEPDSDTSELKKILLELKELVDEGLITEADYEAKKAELLSEL